MALESPIDWASDANYPAGSDPWSGQPTKAAPSSGVIAAGVAPGDMLPADWFNYILQHGAERIRVLQSIVEDSATSLGFTATDANTDVIAEMIRSQAHRQAFSNWQDFAAVTGGLSATAISARSRILTSNTERIVLGFANGAIYTSDDFGLTWDVRTSNTTKKINQIVWNGALFVAVCDDREIVTSPDGETWTARTSNATGATIDIDCVMYDAVNGLWIAMGDVDPTYGYIGTSPDGITWTKQTAHHTGTAIGFARCATGGGFSCAVSQGAGTHVSFSTGGTTWNAAVNPGDTIKNSDVAWFEDRFVIAAEGTTYARSITTQNGTTFTGGTELTSGGSTFDEIFGFGAIGRAIYAREDNTLYMSTDGLAWTRIGQTRPLTSNTPSRAIYAFGRMWALSGQVDLIMISQATGAP